MTHPLRFAEKRTNEEKNNIVGIYVDIVLYKAYMLKILLASVWADRFRIVHKLFCVFDLDLVDCYEQWHINIEH